jgi:Ca-activated chloride channel family protein
MKGRVWGGLAAVVLVTSLTAHAQGPTFRSSTELVTLNVTVIGPNLKPVDGLSQDQFEVFEDGVRQKPEFFARGEMPLDVVVLLDTSASMAGSMELVRGAAVRFVNALRADDRAAIMGISGGLRVVQTFTDDKAVLLGAIKSTTAAGRTPLYAAIYTALRELEKTRRSYDTPRRQSVVVLSDGQDTASGFGFEDLMENVRRQSVAIYTIAPRQSPAAMAQREVVFGESTREQDFELRKIASETGGRAFFPAALHELTGVYDEIAAELSHQYSIGYHSTNPKLDGGFRRIAVRITAPGVRWRTRPGYLASRDITAAGPELR